MANISIYWLYFLLTNHFWNSSILQWRKKSDGEKGQATLKFLVHSSQSKPKWQDELIRRKGRGLKPVVILMLLKPMWTSRGQGLSSLHRTHLHNALTELLWWPSLQEDLHFFKYSQAQPKRSYFWQNRKTSLLVGLHIHSIHSFLGTNIKEANHILSFWASWRLLTAKGSRLMGHRVDPTWQVLGLSAIEAWAQILLCTLINTPPAMKTVSRSMSTYNKKLISK